MYVLNFTFRHAFDRQDTIYPKHTHLDRIANKTRTIGEIRTHNCKREIGPLRQSYNRTMGCLQHYVVVCHSETLAFRHLSLNRPRYNGAIQKDHGKHDWARLFVLSGLLFDVRNFCSDWSVQVARHCISLLDFKLTAAEKVRDKQIEEAICPSWIQLNGKHDSPSLSRCSISKGLAIEKLLNVFVFWCSF